MAKPRGVHLEKARRGKIAEDAERSNRKVAVNQAQSRDAFALLVQRQRLSKSAIDSDRKLFENLKKEIEKLTGNQAEEKKVRQRAMRVAKHWLEMAREIAKSQELQTSIAHPPAVKSAKDVVKYSGSSAPLLALMGSLLLFISVMELLVAKRKV